jgi:pimeloyl-ACP methyl ester carboxylesterase
MRGTNMLIEILKIAGAVAIGLPVFLYFFQDRMLFYPTPRAALSATPRPPRGTLETVTLTAPDGITLSGWFVSSGGPALAPAPLAIYFGGNAEDVSWLIGMNDRLAGYSLLLLEYRGYGGSGGKPGESALFRDALLAYDYASRRRDVDATRIVAFGRSLGSGVAVQLAAQRPVSGVILISPYDSVRAVAQKIYPWLPVSLLLKHPFDSLSRAGAIGAPLLCVAAGRDSVIPVAHSRRLFDAWGGSDRRWVEIAGADHDDVAGEPAYWQEIAAFLARLAARPS